MVPETTSAAEFQLDAVKSTGVLDPFAGSQFWRHSLLSSTGQFAGGQTLAPKRLTPERAPEPDL